MITIIVCGLLYVLGVLVSYASTVLYFYYTIDNYHYCKALRIQAAKYDMGSYCMDVFCFASWLYFIVLAVYVISKLLKYVTDKLIDYIIL